MKKILILSICILLLSSCTIPEGQSQPNGDETEETQGNLPNPASVYCEENGGILEIRSDADGNQAGFCLFPDGSECDEWAYYRGDCQPGAYLPNPASAYCEENGGVVEIRTDAEGNQYGYCIFPDGSECDEWAYYRNECQPGDSNQPGAYLPNPASVYCEENGGIVEIRTDAEGNQYGYCIFPDGSECEEWAYYRDECQPGEYQNQGAYMPNPASVYCEQNGGTTQICTDGDGNQFGYCVFQNGSICDEWAYYRGECEPAGDVDQGWLTYHNEQMDFSFQYPVDAEIEINSDIDTVFVTGPVINDNAWPSFMISYPLDREDYQVPEGSDLQKWLVDHNLSIDQPATNRLIAGKTAIHTRFAGSQQAYAHDKYFFVHDEQLFVITIIHTGGIEDWEVYNRFLGSFQFGQSTDQAWLTYHNEQMNFSFQYPANAEIEVDSDIDTVYVTGPVIDDNAWPSFMISYPLDREDYQVPAGEDLHQWLIDHNLYIDQLAADRLIAGKTAIHTRFEGSQQAYAHDKYFFVNDEQLFVITIGHTGGKEDWEVYSRFLNSFQFDPSPDDQIAPTSIPTVIPFNSDDYQGWWTYTHHKYGFTIMLPEDWVVDERTTFDQKMNYHDINIHHVDNNPALGDNTQNIRLSFRQVGEDAWLWPTGVGQGKFVTQGTLDINGVSAERNFLVCPNGDITAIWYYGSQNEPNIKIGDMEFGVIFTGPPSHCQTGFTFGQKTQRVGEMIIASIRVP